MASNVLVGSEKSSFDSFNSSPYNSFAFSPAVSSGSTPVQLHPHFSWHLKMHLFRRPHQECLLLFFRYSFLLIFFFCEECVFLFVVKIIYKTFCGVTMRNVIFRLIILPDIYHPQECFV